MSGPTPNPTPPAGDEARFRALVDLSPDILSIYDHEGRLTFNSAAAWQTHGYRAADLQGRPTFELVHPEDRAAVEAEFQKLLQNPNQSARVRYRYRNADGSYTWMEATGRNELGTPALNGVISISRDISDRVTAEQALRDGEQQFRMLFAANPHPMMIFDLAALQFVEVNAMALALYGYTRAEFLGLRITDLRPAEAPDHEDQLVDRLRSEPIGDKVKHLRRHRTKDGRTIDVEVTAQRIDWLGRAACIASAHDVTEQRRLQAKLQQTQKLESLGLLAGGIAHDFNNLLTAILGHASIAAEEAPENSEIRESLGLIQESSLRAAELCRQMLAYSGRGRFNVRTLDLSEFVHNTVELLKITIRHNIALQLDLAVDLPPIEADTSQLQQVAMNLVLNAADAIDERGGVIRLATRLEHANRARLETMYLSPLLAEGDYVVLEVSDTGCGMSPATMARIFDPFFTTKFTGRGLGLAAVLGIIRGHQGAIRVESQPGKGSTFTILLPAAIERPAAQPPAASATAAPAAARQGRTVLVVEDEESVRKTVQAMLRNTGLRVLFAEDGLAGVGLYEARHREIDAVLLDLTMPKMGGAEALDLMRAINPSARILLMSGFDESVESARHANRGQMGFLQKPFTARTLLEKIDLALDANPRR